jgi:hypothetical protein
MTEQPEPVADAAWRNWCRNMGLAVMPMPEMFAEGYAAGAADREQAYDEGWQACEEWWASDPHPEAEGASRIRRYAEQAQAAGAAAERALLRDLRRYTARVEAMYSSQALVRSYLPGLPDEWRELKDRLDAVLGPLGAEAATDATHDEGK